MGTRMEVANLESGMNTEDYRKLQSLFSVGQFIKNLEKMKTSKQHV